MDKLEGQDSGINPVFQDMELIGKNKPVVRGPEIDVNPKYVHKLEHPNEADVRLQRLLDQNGKKDYSL